MNANGGQQEMTVCALDALYAEAEGGQAAYERGVEVYAEGDFSFFDGISRSMIEGVFQALTPSQFAFMASYEPIDNGLSGRMSEVTIEPQEHWEGGHIGDVTAEENKPVMLKEIEATVLRSYNGHSGSSFGWTMRTLQRVAKVGWDEFVTEVIQ